MADPHRSFDQKRQDWLNEGMTLVDWLIIGYGLLGALTGFWRGFIAYVFKIVAIVASAGLAMRFYPKLAGLLDSALHLPASLSQPVALAIVFFVLLAGLNFAAKIILKAFGFLLAANPINRVAGAVLGAAESLLLAGIVLTLLVTLPTPGNVKSSIEMARFGQPLVAVTLKLNDALGRASGQTGLNLAFQLPAGDAGSTPLNFTETNPKEDIESEIKLAALLAALRAKNKKSLLAPNLKLQEVAKAHAKDMLTRNFFGHVSPEGVDTVGRLQKAGLTAAAVGENLAHAPTLELAQAGLVASPRHRKNMLSDEFNAVGLAVFDAGGNGKIVVELFAQF